MLLGDATSRAFRIVLLVAALFAILVQSVLVQAHTHVHQDMAPLVHSVAIHAVAGATDNGPTHQDEPDCPVCWEMAHAGAFVLPEDPVLRIPEPSAIWRGALLQSVSARNGRSHAWHSRAPPLALQA